MASGAEAASALAEALDEGRLVPSRDLMESLAQLNASIARWARREQHTLRLVRAARESD